MLKSIGKGFGDHRLSNAAAELSTGLRGQLALRDYGGLDRFWRIWSCCFSEIAFLLLLSMVDMMKMINSYYDYKAIDLWKYGDVYENGKFKGILGSWAKTHALVITIYMYYWAKYLTISRKPRDIVINTKPYINSVCSKILIGIEWLSFWRGFIEIPKASCKNAERAQHALIIRREAC